MAYQLAPMTGDLHGFDFSSINCGAIVCIVVLWHNIER